MREPLGPASSHFAFTVCEFHRWGVELQVPDKNFSRQNGTGKASLAFLLSLFILALFILCEEKGGVVIVTTKPVETTYIHTNPPNMQLLTLL